MIRLVKILFYDALHKYTDDYQRDVKGNNVQVILGGLRFIEHPNTTFRKNLNLPNGMMKELYIHDSLERLANHISNQTIAFHENPAMAWNFGCIQVERKAETLRMTKDDAAELSGGRMDIFASIVYGFGVMEKAVKPVFFDDNDYDDEEAWKELAEAMKS